MFQGANCTLNGPLIQRYPVKPKVLKLAKETGLVKARKQNLGD